MNFLLNVHRCSNSKKKLFSLGKFEAKSIDEAKEMACRWINQHYTHCYTSPSMWQSNEQHYNPNQWLIRDFGWDVSFCLTYKKFKTPKK